jgi:hypothetical protein
LAREANRLLTDAGARQEMKAGLAAVKDKLTQSGLPAPRRAASVIEDILEGQIAHVS